jgi:hypothetical protein
MVQSGCTVSKVTAGSGAGVSDAWPVGGAVVGVVTGDGVPGGEPTGSAAGVVLRDADPAGLAGRDMLADCEGDPVGLGFGFGDQGVEGLGASNVVVGGAETVAGGGGPPARAPTAEYGADQGHARKHTEPCGGARTAPPR